MVSNANKTAFVNNLKDSDKRKTYYDEDKKLLTYDFVRHAIDGHYFKKHPATNYQFGVIGTVGKWSNVLIRWCSSCY